MDERPLRKASEFSEIISSAALPLVVGGQAANLWAELCSESVPSLDSFESSNLTEGNLPPHP